MNLRRVAAELNPVGHIPEYGQGRLEVHYNKADNTALCRITLSGETLPAVQQTTRANAVLEVT